MRKNPRTVMVLMVTAIATLPVRAREFHESHGTSGEAPWETSLPSEEQSREGELYQRGTEAIDDQDWTEAVEAFDEVVRLKGSRADAGLYWKAYALQKVGNRAEALAALEALKTSFPQSRWLRDGKALELEIRQSSGQTPNPEQEDDLELKLLALNSLMNSDPERALPVLEDILSKEGPPKLKERALFVLAQSSSPRAREVLADIARGKKSPALQMKAINNLSVFGGKESRQTLADLYASSTDAAVKRAILRGFMVAGEKDRLLSAARTETAPELRAEAIQQLGVMGAHDELWQLYQAEAAPELKKKMIHAFFVGGASERLSELAQKEKDPMLRREAIRNLGLTGSRRSSETLVAIYGSETELAVRKEVINALFVQGNAKALIELFRKEKDPGLKKAIINQLSVMGSKESTEFMLEILKK